LAGAKVKVLKGLEEGVLPAFVRFFNSALFDRLLHGLVLYFVALLQQELLQHWTERTRTAAHAGGRGTGGAGHAWQGGVTGRQLGLLWC
jgi:hypothetical protein